MTSTPFWVFILYDFDISTVSQGLASVRCRSMLTDRMWQSAFYVFRIFLQWPTTMVPKLGYAVLRGFAKNFRGTARGTSANGILFGSSLYFPLPLLISVFMKLYSLQHVALSQNRMYSNIEQFYLCFALSSKLGIVSQSFL